jgi:uncharacterized protein (TIGR02117 family)
MKKPGRMDGPSSFVVHSSRSLRRKLLGVLLLPFLFLLIYVGFGFGLGALSLPKAASLSENDHPISIFVVSNGYHASLVLPLRAGGTDWGSQFPRDDFADPPADATHVMFGWGDRDFYMNTRRLADLEFGLMVRAALGLGGTVMHVVLVGAPRPGADVRAISVTPAGYARLVRYIEGGFARDGEGRLRLHPGRGYGPHDAFYQGTGRYSLFNTCNEWVGRGLRAAAIPVGVWTPFASSLLREPSGL